MDGNLVADGYIMMAFLCWGEEHGSGKSFQPGLIQLHVISCRFSLEHGFYMTSE